MTPRAGGAQGSGCCGGAWGTQLCKRGLALTYHVRHVLYQQVCTGQTGVLTPLNNVSEFIKLIWRQLADVSLPFKCQVCSEHVRTAPHL